MTPVETAHFDKVNAICVSINQGNLKPSDVVSILIALEFSVKPYDKDCAQRIADFWIAEHVRGAR